MTDQWADTDEEVPHPLLGQRIRVRLTGSMAKGREDGTDVWVEGVLLKLTTGGEIDVAHVDGTTHYCWPALHIEPA